MKITDISTGFRSIGLAAAFAISTLFAAAGAQSLSMEEVAATIVNASPRLSLLSAEKEASLASLSTSGNLPDPVLEGEFLAAPAGETNRWGAGLSWSLDWPGVYAARKNEAKAAAKGIYAGMAASRKAVSIEVGRLLLDYILASRQMTLIDGMIEANDSIGHMAEKSFRGGEMTRLDLAKIRIENVSLTSRRLEVQDAMEAAKSALSEIYGKDSASLLENMACTFPEVEIPDAAHLQALGSVNPAVAEAEASVEEARLAGVTSAREGLPSISFGYRHAFEDGVHFNGASLGLSLPIFSSRGKAKAAKAASIAAEYGLEATKNDVALGIDRTLARLISLSNGVRSLESALEQADDSALLMKAYEAKVITLIELLNERNYFLEARLSHLDLQHALANARLDLDAFLP